MNLLYEIISPVKNAEIVVGIPSCNEVNNIAYVTKVVDEGLRKYYPDMKAVIINVDNNSPDGTKEAFINTKTRTSKIYVSTPPDVSGKGNNFHNLFEMSVRLKAKYIITVDADLKSITPEWIYCLCQPLLEGYNYVTPLYKRHKYDGSITNNICCPLVRSYFKKQIRQPIGGDFGFSGELAKIYLEEDWNEIIGQFGIDIWMTIIAIVYNFKICETVINEPKIHNPKDPGSDLGPMFVQVVSALFELISKFPFIEGFSKSVKRFHYFEDIKNIDPPSINVNTKVLLEKYKNGFDCYISFWEKVIKNNYYSDILKELNEIIDEDKFFITDITWGKILTNFIECYKISNIFDKKLIVESMIPLYYARVLSFVNITKCIDSSEKFESYFNKVMNVLEKISVKGK